MKQCWSEGALRAYLDRELPTEDMQRLAAHLGSCPACDGLCTELATRAAHVSALMELLPEFTDVTAVCPVLGRPIVAEIRRPLRPNWVVIAVAVAACLALAVYLRPNRTITEALVPTPAPAPAPRSVLPQPVPPEVPQLAPRLASAVADTAPIRAVPASTRRLQRGVRKAADLPSFVALDDEPFESGIIMRVDVKPGNMQADIVFGPDGRAHAFRLVNPTRSNY